MKTEPSEKVQIIEAMNRCHDLPKRMRTRFSKFGRDQKIETAKHVINGVLPGEAIERVRRAA